MKKIKVMLRSAAFIFMVVIVCVGAGLLGALPIFQHKRRAKDDEVNIELVEREDEEE